MSREQRLEAALRDAEGDLLRYGQHDSDCPAREYVLVDGIPTTCDCGLNLALDSARLAAAVLGEQEATPPEPMDWEKHAQVALEAMADAASAPQGEAEPPNYRDEDGTYPTYPVPLFALQGEGNTDE